MANTFGMAQDRYEFAVLLNVSDELIGPARYDQVNVCAVELKQIVDLLSRVEQGYGVAGSEGLQSFLYKLVE